MDRDKIKAAINDLDKAGEDAEIKYFDNDCPVTLWRERSGLLVALVKDRDGYIDLPAIKEVLAIARELGYAYR